MATERPNKQRLARSEHILKAQRAVRIESVLNTDVPVPSLLGEAGPALFTV
eukprot:SAG31_NODE_5452_length_2531_cov_1.865954_1_plen_50_part_10